MNTQIAKLIASIRSVSNPDLRADMISQFAFILELSNGADKSKGEYILILAPEQFKINLTREEQDEVVDSVIKIIQKTDNDVLKGGLLWSIGKADKIALTAKLQEYLLDNFAELSADLAYQGIISLGNCFPDQNSKDYKYITSILEFSRLEAMFQELSKSSDERLSKQANVYLGFIDMFRDEGAFS